DGGKRHLTEEVCEGCGAPLQSDRPDQPGYVPAHVVRRGDQVVCRRCYRLSHYGKDESARQTDTTDAWGIAADVISTVDASVMIVDVIDFEGSYMPRLARMTRGKLFVAVNKVDLLPGKTPMDEVADWMKARLVADEIPVEGVYPISAQSGYGGRVLLEALKKSVGKGGRVALIGATNVGKSTLLKRWTSSGRGSKGVAPTASRFPGTTVGVIERELGREELELLDTPGLSTKGRLTEIVCPQCAAKLVPTSPITSKLLRVLPGQSILLGGLAAMTPIDITGERITLVFASGAVQVLKMSEEKARRALFGDPGGNHARQGPELLCGSCRAAVQKTG